MAWRRDPREAWKPAAAALLVAFASLPAVALADHPQDRGDGGTIVFDHRGGNEWWVELKLTVSEVHSVWARAEGGDWHRMELRSWGNYGVSFHIPPGERVQFQAVLAGSGGRFDIYRATSCFFTHPLGVEQCDPGSTDRYGVNFSNPSGNEWWAQVFVKANRPVTQVFVAIHTVDGFQLKPLSLRSWGAWAASYHAPEGTTLKFVASNAAERAESGCFRWTSATPVSCPSEDGAPPNPGDTTFDHKTGNEWWVEVLVGPIEPRRVLAQDDRGPWVELTRRDWGAWAASFHIEPGHRVHFRAEVSGGVSESCWFTHPEGRTPDGGQTCGGTSVGDA